MKVSVLLPYYNEEETILKTLNSLHNQSKKIDEIVFIDSGSTDDTSNIINKWISENNADNFKNIFSGKMSPSSSINLGIESTTSDYIGYLDCGLNIPIEWHENISKYISGNIPEVISCSIYTEGTSLLDKSLIAQTYGFKKKSICLTGSLISRKVFNKIGFFLPNVRANYDVDFINKIKKHNIKRSITYDYPLMYYDINYSNDMFSAFKKVFSYSISGLYAKGDIKPFMYFISLTTFLYINIEILILIYFFLRTLVIPIIKSGYTNLMSDLYIFLLLPITGLIIDSARILGYSYAILVNIKNKIINDK